MKQRSADIWGIESEPKAHLIQNKENLSFTPRGILKFMGAVQVFDEDDKTVIIIEQGRQGKDGQKGDTGAMPKIVETRAENLSYTAEPYANLEELKDGEYKLEFGIPAGKTGAVPEIEAFAKSLEAGAEAQVNLIHDGDIYKLEFAIPRGFDGINLLEVGSTVTESADKPALVVNTDDPENPEKKILEFRIPKGVTYTPSVDESSLITWTNDGGLENPAPQNIQGVSCSIERVSITLIEPLEEPKVENLGTAHKVELLFSLPKAAIFIPHIDENGLLTWDNDGELANPAPFNLFRPAQWNILDES